MSSATKFHFDPKLVEPPFEVDGDGYLCLNGWSLIESDGSLANNLPTGNILNSYGIFITLDDYVDVAKSTVLHKFRKQEPVIEIPPSKPPLTEWQKGIEARLKALEEWRRSIGSVTITFVDEPPADFPPELVETCLRIFRDGNEDGMERMENVLLHLQKTGRLRVV